MEIETQFQQDSNADVKQSVQRKEKYAYRFGKIKKALYLALDLGCETEFIDMVNGFINCKKNDIDDTNDENKENLSVSDPLIRKWRRRSPHKRIKSALENAHHSTKISALNPPDPNLQSSSRIPLYAYDVSNHGQDNDHMALDDIGENTSKRKYICKVCGEPGHNARNKAKCIKQD
ncbi:8829_t:CDS:2, partial [Funneliformis caledonium]